LPPTGQSIASVREKLARGPRLSGLKLTRTNELKAPRATILLYAPPRWGKTHSIQTLTNPLILATELGDTNGLLTLSHLDLPFIAIEDSMHFKQVVTELILKDCTVEGHRYETIVIDSLSNLGYIWLEDGMRAMGWDDLWLTMEAKKDPRRAYSYLAEKGRTDFKLALSLDANLVAICRETIEEEGDEKNKIRYSAPELPGQKLGRELPGWPDAVVRGDIINGKRLLRTRTHLRAVAGIRAPGDVNIPEYINPNLQALIDLMLGDKTALAHLEVKRDVPTTR
jgi:hypothetical protein